MKKFSEITAAQFATMAWPGTGQTLHVDPNGSDTKAATGKAVAFLTLTAAKTAAVSGDTIVVHPGTYAEHNLLKTGVNWFFMAGASINYTNTDLTSGNARGIWDDRDTGAVTCQIGGFGKFYFNAGVAAYNGIGGDTPGPATLLGGIVIQNAASDLSICCEEVRIRSYFSSPQYVYAVYVKACSRFTIVARKIYEDATDFANFQEIDPGDPTTVNSNASGIYWENGEMNVTAEVIKASRYCIWGSRSAASTATNLWVTCNLIENYGSESALYLDSVAGGSATWKSWVSAKEIKGGAQAVAGASYYAGGKHYLTVNKVSSTIGTGITCAATAASELWITAQKVTGATIGLSLAAGNVTTVYADIQQIEDLAAMTSGVNVVAGTLRLTNTWIKVLNGKGIVHSGGATRILNCTIDTSNTDLAANTGANATAAGLVLGGCTLKVGATSGVSVGAGGTTVKCFPTCFSNKAATATIQGTLTIDANVT